MIQGLFLERHTIVGEGYFFSRRFDEARQICWRRSIWCRTSR
jgi:hypothetical protein